MRVMSPTPVGVAALVLVGGCSCSQDYAFSTNFGELEPPPSADAPGPIGPYVAFDTAPDGERITLAYYEEGEKAVGYAVGTVDAEGVITWSYEEVDGYAEGKRGRYVSQATAADGTVWVAYLDDDAPGLRARKRVGGGQWEDAVAVDRGGLWTHMAMVGSRPVVVHTDGGDLRLSTLVDGEWSSATIFSSADTPGVLPDGTEGVLPAEVRTPKVVVDDDAIRVVVHDAARGELHMLSGDLDAATADDFTDLIVEGGGAGAWPSALVVDGDLHVAYQDVSSQQLRLAVHEGGDAFQRETVDDGPLRGADTELYVDAAGRLNILYFDGWDANLLKATRDADSWSIEILRGDTTAAGFHNAVGGVGDLRYAGTLDYTTGEYEIFQIP